MKDALIIYDGQEISRLEKCLPNQKSQDRMCTRRFGILNEYFIPKRNKTLLKVHVSQDEPTGRRNYCNLCHEIKRKST